MHKNSQIVWHNVLNFESWVLKCENWNFES